MKKKILEYVLHSLHIIYESIKNMGIALAKILGITGKSKLLLTRKIVLISFIIISALLVALSATESTSVQDGPYMNPQLPAGFYNNMVSSNNVTRSPSNDMINTPSNNVSTANGPQQAIIKLCTNCHGTGTIKQTYIDTVWVPCATCGGNGIIEGIDSYECPVCHGTGGHFVAIPKTRDITCPTCGGKGNVPA